MTEVRLAVVGLGKLGLPLAAFYALRGARVIGCDRAPSRLDAIRAGTAETAHEQGLDEALAEIGDRLILTTDTAAAVAESDHVIVVVPVLARADGTADFSAVDAAVAAIASGLRAGTALIVETTVPVGTTRRRLLPQLASSALLLGEELFVAHSPERVLVGRIFRDLDTYPKIVGGVDQPSGERAATFYEKFLRAPVWRVRDAETAELTKLAETTYRTTNIALANELAMVADRLGIDVVEVIRGANSQPYSHIHAPGLGVGGHCLPVYPFLLQYNGIHVPLVMEGQRINSFMARYAAARLAAALDGLAGRRVLILGIAYRPGVKEHAFSPAFTLRDALREAGARVLAHDPLYTEAELRDLEFEPARLAPPPEVDAVVLQTAHDAFLTLDERTFPRCRVVLDGRNVLERHVVEAAGARYLGVGR